MRLIFERCSGGPGLSVVLPNVDREDAPPDAYALDGYTCLFPVTSLAAMASLLEGAFGPAPTILAGFNCSGQLRSDVAAVSGKVVVSVDLKGCALRGLHACLDVCDVIDMIEWDEVYLNPSCMFSSISDTTCMHLKVRDGRFWWGVAKVALCICAPAKKTFVEQPLNMAEEAIGILASQSIDPRDYNDRVKKTLRVWVFGGDLIKPPAGLVATAHASPAHELVRCGTTSRHATTSTTPFDRTGGFCPTSLGPSPKAWGAMASLILGTATRPSSRPWRNAYTTSACRSSGITPTLTPAPPPTPIARTLRLEAQVMGALP